MTENLAARQRANDLALSEACLRLAYYAHRYGAIPDADVVELFGVVTLKHGNSEFVAIRDLAKELKDYFLEMHQPER